MPLWDKINVFFLLCSRLHTVVKTIPTFMVLATCAQRKYVTLGASCRRETVSRQKTELRTPLNRKGNRTQTTSSADWQDRWLCSEASLRRTISAGARCRHSWRWESPTHDTGQQSSTRQPEPKLCVSQQSLTCLLWCWCVEKWHSRWVGALHRTC